MRRRPSLAICHEKVNGSTIRIDVPCAFDSGLSLLTPGALLGLFSLTKKTLLAVVCAETVNVVLVDVVVTIVDVCINVAVSVAVDTAIVVLVEVASKVFKLVKVNVLVYCVAEMDVDVLWPVFAPLSLEQAET